MTDGFGGNGRIVHVSADVPDSVQPAKTRVIETLVGMVADRFDQEVLSLNRVWSPGRFLRIAAHPLRPPLQVQDGGTQGGVTALRYEAPGWGILHATMLRQLGDWLAERLANGPRPALLVGHKLTVEGIAVRQAARRLGIPYALSIQGNTDLKIASSRPDLRRELARCFHEAAVVMPFSPWALHGLERLLGKRAGPCFMLPCPVASDAVTAPRSGGDGLVTAFHLRHHRIKNLDTMAKATDHLARAIPGAGLTVIGGGDAADREACARIVERHPGVTLEGPQPLAQMPARLNRASGFVLASRRESFGLVFIESLFAGTPIAYPADLAVDGYFDGAPFALRVDNRSPEAIAEAMARMLREEDALKQALAAWQASPQATQFKRATIAETFAAALRAGAAGGLIQ